MCLHHSICFACWTICKYLVRSAVTENYCLFSNVHWCHLTNGIISMQKSAGGVLLPKSAVKFERYLMGEVGKQLEMLSSRYMCSISLYRNTCSIYVFIFLFSKLICSFSGSFHWFWSWGCGGWEKGRIFESYHSTFSFTPSKHVCFLERRVK